MSLLLLFQSPPTNSGNPTEANDTSTASGTPVVTGTSARTEANDTSTAAGTPVVTGTAARTEAADTSTASGAPVITGSSARTESADTSTASGAPIIDGTAAYIEPADTSQAEGSTGDTPPNPEPPTEEHGSAHPDRRPGGEKDKRKARFTYERRPTIRPRRDDDELAAIAAVLLDL